MAHNHPDSNTDVREKLKDDRKKLKPWEIYNEITVPHNFILLKLQVLGAELWYDDERDIALVADARRYASESVMSLIPLSNH